jgi:hypothetical protein
VRQSALILAGLDLVLLVLSTWLFGNLIRKEV